MHEHVYAPRSLAPSHQRRTRRALRCLALSALLAAALAMAGCFESKVVTSKVVPHTPADKEKEMNGVFYALPRTVVKADVPVVRTNRQPGLLSHFTPCEGFFPNEKYVFRKGSEFNIDADKIVISTEAVPDTDEVFMIKTKGGMFETRNLEMTLTEGGMLVKANAEFTNDTIDIVTGAIKAGAGVLAKALPLIPLSGGVTLTPEQERCRSLVVEKWADELELTTIINAAGVINEAELGKVKAIPEMVREPARFKAGYEEALRIVTQINDFVDRRTSILAEQPSSTPQVATVNADSMKLVFDELGKTTKELKDTYFIGSESTAATWNASFRLNPSLPGKMLIELFTLSKELGVCKVLVNDGADNGQGLKPPPAFKIAKRCKDGAASCKPKEMEPVACTGQKVQLVMALGENGEGGPGGTQLSERIYGAGLRENGDRGFYYRIPGRAVAFIRREQEKAPAEELARKTLSVAQFGRVASLPASTGGRKTKYTLELFESSGGMKNFVMGSSSLIQQKNIDDLAGGASSLVDAKIERNKERDKANAPPDELLQLERQRKILEERKKIRDLERELNSAGDESDEEQNP